MNVDGGLMGLNSPEVIDSVSSALKDSTQKTGELTEASMVNAPFINHHLDRAFSHYSSLSGKI